MAREQAERRRRPRSLSAARLPSTRCPLGVVVADGDGAVRAPQRRRPSTSSGCATPTCSSTRPSALTCAARSPASHRRQTLELYGPPERTVVVTAVPVDSETGAFAALATIEDVTERSRLEAMRTDFVANISHELKTPVGALALLAEALVDEDESERRAAGWPRRW